MVSDKVFENVYYVKQETPEAGQMMFSGQDLGNFSKGQLDSAAWQIIKIWDMVSHNNFFSISSLSLYKTKHHWGTRDTILAVSEKGKLDNVT